MTYSDFQATPQSEKLGLVILHQSQLLRGWSVYSGSIYEIFFDRVIHSVEVLGVSLTEVGSLGSVVAGSYFQDRTTSTLYVRTLDSADPNTKTIVVESKLFFANATVTAPHDMGSGFEVLYRPLLKGTSDFGVELDNSNQFGLALEGTGSIDLINDSVFWSPIYDKLTFENKKCFVYSWSRTLPMSEAKLIYKGIVERKSWSPQSVQFRLKDSISEIRAQVPVDNLDDYPAARVTERLRLTKQRTVYGYVFGHVPSSIDGLIGGTYPLTGTFTASGANATVTGSGTQFLAELNPGDQIVFSFDTDATRYSVKSVASNTSLELSEEYEGLSGSGSAEVLPERDKRYINREHLIAGHSLRQPSTTVTVSGSLAWIDVASSQDMMAGDVITVGSEQTNISRVSGNRLFLSPFLELPASVGASVTRLAVSSACLNDRELVYGRDYTVDASTAVLTLDPLAEVNVAPVRAVTGSVTFTNGSRTVTGTGTIFDEELKPSDWIRAFGEADYFEVLSVDSETQLTLRTNATYSVTAAARYKSPEYFGDQVTLAVDCLGKTSTGAPSGNLIKSGPDIVKNILDSVGIPSTDIDTASFTESKELAYQRLGVVIPSKQSDKKAPTARDVINSINRSIFGSLVQTADFKLKYNILEPQRTTDVLQLSEKDFLSFKINSDSSRIVSTAKVNYLKKEFDCDAKASSFAQVKTVSTEGTYLVKSNKTYEHESILVDETDAQLLCNRFAFLYSAATASMQIDTKLITSQMEVNDRVTLNHEKLFERIGSSDKRKTMAVQGAKKTVFDSSLNLDDLGNAFSRCSVITENTHPEFSTSTQAERINAGYITDNNGMQSNDGDTFGIHLIW